MSARFTVEDAMDASECGDPIMISKSGAVAIVRKHDCDQGDFETFWNECEVKEGLIDVATLFTWLGY